MTAPKTALARQATPGGNLLLWGIGAIVAFLVLFWLITLALQLPIWPEAIQSLSCSAKSFNCCTG